MLHQCLGCCIPCPIIAPPVYLSPAPLYLFSLEFALFLIEFYDPCRFGISGSIEDFCFDVVEVGSAREFCDADILLTTELLSPVIFSDLSSSKLVVFFCMFAYVCCLLYDCRIPTLCGSSGGSCCC